MADAPKFVSSEGKTKASDASYASRLHGARGNVHLFRVEIHAKFQILKAGLSF